LKKLTDERPADPWHEFRRHVEQNGSVAEAVVASLREVWRALRTAAPRRVRVRAVGRAEPDAIRCGRPFRGSNAAGNDAFAVGWHPAMGTSRKLIRTNN
jgi:hypothetical protein